VRTWNEGFQQLPPCWIPTLKSGVSRCSSKLYNVNIAFFQLIARIFVNDTIRKRIWIHEGIYLSTGSHHQHPASWNSMPPRPGVSGGIRRYVNRIMPLFLCQTASITLVAVRLCLSTIHKELVSGYPRYPLRRSSWLWDQSWISGCRLFRCRAPGAVVNRCLSSGYFCSRRSRITQFASSTAMI
jgi:hypothetical protein